jgi:hypothetical protein
MKEVKKGKRERKEELREKRGRKEVYLKRKWSKEEGKGERRKSKGCDRKGCEKWGHLNSRRRFICSVRGGGKFVHTDGSYESDPCHASCKKFKNPAPK